MKLEYGTAKNINNMAKVSEIVDNIVNRNGKFLISILEDIQEHYNYLPADAIKEVAKQLKLSLVDVYGVATFFHAFSLKPRGKHLVTVCLGTACHVRGGPKIATEIERLLNIKSGETTKDNEFTLETVNCLGACALGPIVVVDGEYHGQVSTRKVKSILDKYKNETIKKSKRV